MSESERKKRSQCIDVWEEAGSEFYQESYPGMEADLEAFQKNPNKLSTLLPSNKTRTARKKINNGTVCYQATATLKPVEYGTLCQNTMGCNNEIQISLMPDLSENLSNEELVWEEIMKIKTMPISMAHKKELKAKLKSADAFRLQGFQQLKWQKRKICNCLKTKWLEFYNKFHLWSSSLKKIEGHCGAEHAYRHRCTDLKQSRKGTIKEARSPQHANKSLKSINKTTSSLLKTNTRRNAAKLQHELQVHRSRVPAHGSVDFRHGLHDRVQKTTVQR